jgi:DNA primase
LGTVLTDSQKFILDCSSGSTIFIVGDNDQPGERAAKEIVEKCQKLYRVEKFDWKGIAVKDVGEMSNKLVQEKIGEIVNRLSGLN